MCIPDSPTRRILQFILVYGGIITKQSNGSGSGSKDCIKKRLRHQLKLIIISQRNSVPTSLRIQWSIYYHTHLQKILKC